MPVFKLTVEFTVEAYSREGAEDEVRALFIPDDEIETEVSVQFVRTEEIEG